MKLGLGTVQFGLHYGVSNKEGAPSYEEVKKIISTAYQGGIRLIDTAPAYASSESTLGGLMPGYDFKLVSKTPAARSDTIAATEVGFLEKTFYQSLSRLQQKKLYGLLVHQCDDLFKKNGELIFQKMRDLQEAGLIDKVGVSVYTAAQIETVIKHYPIDLVQLPVNVLDQRLVMDGTLSRLKKKGIEVHARSVFLQGLLLMEPGNLHPFFNPIKGHLKHYHEFIQSKGFSPIEAALLYVLNIEEIDYIIIGVNNDREMSEIMAVENSMAGKIMDFKQFSLHEEKYLNPSLWVC